MLSCESCCSRDLATFSNSLLFSITDPPGQLKLLSSKVVLPEYQILRPAELYRCTYYDRVISYYNETKHVTHTHYAL